MEFCDLLYEISNDYRFMILLELQNRKMNVTKMSRYLDISIQQSSRHISRLCEIGLTQKDLEGHFHLTPFGESVLKLLPGLRLLSRHKEYFIAHTMTNLPSVYLKRIDELEKSTRTDNVMIFLHSLETTIKDAEEYVWLLVDQYPLTALASMIDALKRGVKFRIIGPRGISGPLLTLESHREMQALMRARHTPFVEQRTLDEMGVFLYLSEQSSALSFPIPDGSSDYQGFTSRDEQSLKWCRDLYQHYWDISESRVPIPPTEKAQIRTQAPEQTLTGRVVVTGQNNHLVDAQAVQDATDNYDEIILRGVFDFGNSSILVRRSVIIRGEGRENDIPSTKIYKKGWTFPFSGDECVFNVNGDEIDVTIENIHFTDFNYIGISNERGNSVQIRKNRFTLNTGLGRGRSYGHYGDLVIGIASSGTREHGSFPGGALIEENYLDFALSFIIGGYTPTKGLETGPEYRPDLVNHESYIGYGIFANRNIGEVVIRDNVVRNMNGRGITALDNWESAKIRIVNNTIISDVYGSYPFNTHLSGTGILVQSASSLPKKGSEVEIANNTIRCSKLNYCGIAVHGPSLYLEGSGKLGECVVKGNEIYLDDGAVGVYLRKSDGIYVHNNRISGKAYYGIQVSGIENRVGFDLGANGNVIEDNDLTNLELKNPDEYSDNHVDGRMFAGTKGESATAQIWLNTYTKDNLIEVEADETVIDEGVKNILTHAKKEETI